MNCNELKEYISAYVDDELMQTQRNFVEEHLATCEDCQRVMASYRTARETLTSLRATPPMQDIRETTMERVNTDKLLRKPRRWLKPALIAVSVIVIIIAAQISLPLTSRLGIQKVLAEAQDALATIKSYRVVSTPGIYVAGQDNTNNSKFEEFVLPDRAHLKFTINGVTSEYIFIGENQYYSTNNTLTFSFPYMPIYPQNTGNARQNLMEITMDKLQQSTNIAQLPDEILGNVYCVHYKGIEQHNPYSIELWIGKDDHIIRQVIEEPIRSSAENIDPPSTKTTFFDFNVSITIEAPLSDSGALLPDWKMADSSP